MKIVAPRVLKFAKAVGHPLRIDILLLLGELERASPTSISARVGSPLDVVAYHVKRLADAGAVVEVDRQPRRGAAEHFYAITDYGMSALQSARFISSPWPDRPSAEDDSRDEQTEGDGHTPGSAQTGT
jgi:DNA-binding transcriptional ArsR family regulator